MAHPRIESEKVNEVLKVNMQTSATYLQHLYQTQKCRPVLNLNDNNLLRCGPDFVQ